MDKQASRIGNLTEREKNMVLDTPLHTLQKTEKYDLPMRHLGIAVLLFILEHMYQNTKECTEEAIREFLRDYIEEQFEVVYSEDVLSELTKHILFAHLMNNGAPHKEKIWNNEKKRGEVFEFHLVLIDEFKVKGSVYFKLSDECIDMLYKTKELYGELRTSIRALFFRQQVEKGVFEGALQELKEMLVDVYNERQEIIRLKKTIQKNTLKTFQSGEIEKRIERINERFERKQEVFSDMLDFIEDTRKHKEEEELGEKAETVQLMIGKMKRGLEGIIRDHEALFGDKLDLQTYMSNALESLVMESFGVRFNLEKELFHPSTSEEIDTDTLISILDPLFDFKHPKRFHPGEIFEPQAVRKKRKQDEDGNQFGELDTEWADYLDRIDEERSVIRIDRYAAYLETLLMPLTQKEEVTMEEIIHTGELDEEDIVGADSFLPLVIYFHQLGETELVRSHEAISTMVDEIPKAIMKTADKDVFGQLGGFVVEEGEGTITLQNGFTLSNFKIKRRDRNGRI
ncbi:hypothetical protein IMZ31_19320 (plasmid) [Pontibacillus sp. ALD_SL1]|uniref:hypothetical protein n=1 Tax=Pontibacillus sp. ALD_SL1 TaxID=2777185 RepID=UPI001A969734|nr:hypothetical protein [Pontibacillus sp. ALD_SL1]QST02701.1 hypothetical protein IMZ31_19320 [Pontibacillus sp. ALD_SL1]